MSKKYIEQASAVPFKYFNGDIKILLITSRNEKKWIIPKGIIENHQTPRQAALAEAFEEAGVEGVLHDIKMGVYYYSRSIDNYYHGIVRRGLYKSYSLSEYQF